MGKKGQKADIKPKGNQLKNLLKDISLGDSEPDKESGGKEKAIAPQKKKPKKRISNIVLNNIPEILKDTDYQKTKSVYVDEDIHEIFTLIKKHYGISIGGLLSYLGERFIAENKKEIIETNKNNNKYLK